MPLVSFSEILHADRSMLERLLLSNTPAVQRDAWREAKAHQLGVNVTRLICGVGFNVNARDRNDLAQALGYRSFDVLVNERNYRLIHDHYDELTVGNIIEIYAVVGHDRRTAQELYDPVFSRLAEIESQLEGTINPILVSGYKLEIRNVYSNGLASKALLAHRLQPHFSVLRDISGELQVMLETRAITPERLLRLPGVNVNEKSRLIFQGLIPHDVARAYLQESGVSASERDALAKLIK